MTAIVTSSNPHPVAVSLRTIEEELNSHFLERRVPLRALLIAVLAKQHGFILGPPGTAKSALIRTLFSRIEGAVYFEQLLSKFRPPEAVLGPYSIIELKNDHFVRKVDGFLPTAHFAMLDEVGKMSPALGHELLSLVNERILHQVNGSRSTQSVPLMSFFGGSNELPTAENDDAAALYDRILVRLQVDNLQETGNVAAMLSGPRQCPPGTTIQFPDLQLAVETVVPEVKIPDPVISTVIRLRQSLLSEDLVVSDRRLNQSMSLLQASAFLAGRDEATDDDVEVLQHAFWDNPAHIDKVARLCMKVSNPMAEAALAILEKVESVQQEIRATKGQAADARARVGTELMGRTSSIKEELTKLRAKAEREKVGTTKIDEVDSKLLVTRRQIMTDFLSIPDDMLPE